MPQISLQPSSSDFELLVDFEYFAAEPPERGPEARQPGVPAHIEIEAVTLNGHNITSLLSKAQMQALEEDIWTYITGLEPDYSDLEPLPPF